MTELQKAMASTDDRNLTQTEYWKEVALKLGDKVGYVRCGAKDWKKRALRAENQLDNAAAIYTKREEEYETRLQTMKMKLDGERIWRENMLSELNEVKAHAYDLMKEGGVI